MEELVLDARSLLSKWGFNDGDTPDGYLDWLDERGLSYPDDWDEILRHLVRTRLLRDLDGDVEVYDIETSHNPIRARKVNGVEIDDTADNDDVFPDVVVTVSFEDVYEVQQMIAGKAA